MRSYRIGVILLDVLGFGGLGRQAHISEILVVFVVVYLLSFINPGSVKSCIVYVSECYVVHNSQELDSKLLNNQCVDKIFKKSQ